MVSVKCVSFHEECVPLNVGCMILRDRYIPFFGSVCHCMADVCHPISWYLRWCTVSG